jgi:hypothetical protein
MQDAILIMKAIRWETINLDRTASVVNAAGDAALIVLRIHGLISG